MSPSKLTDPELLLHDRAYAAAKKPAAIKVEKSLSRELKTIEKEENDLRNDKR